MFCCAIVNLGINDAAKQLKCRFTVCSDKEEIISICQRVRNFHKGAMSNLEPRNCITIHLETMKQFVDADGSLKCEIEFYEVGTGSIDCLRKTGIADEVNSFTPRRSKVQQQHHISNVIYSNRIHQQVSAVQLNLTDEDW
ncbi:hypothetical protein C0J52_16604 [Blattella germanica]|nr:hypothetical protein C0J52_16604 [Blattella germanica]